MDEHVKSVPKEYFLDEVRDGFFVPTMMKRSWAAMLSNYAELEDFCRKNGADCFVVWGSMLGAIRHGGFVPWDDDIDVAMLREYYDMIKEAADRGELPGGHWLDDYRTGDVDNTKSRWLDTRDVVRSQEQSAENFGFPFINIIDIDVFDNIPHAGVERDLYEKIVEVIVQIRSNAEELERMSEDDPNIVNKKNELVAQIAKISEVTGYPYDFDDPRIVLQLMCMIEHYSRQIDSGSSGEVTILPYYMNGKTYLFPRRYIKDCIDVDFEYTTVRVPVGYERILKSTWPNYATPYIDYDSHSYPYFREMEKELKDLYGIEFMTYHIYPEEYEQITGSRMEKVSLQEFVRSSLELLKEAHGFLEGAVAGGADGLDDAFFEVLGECQNVAVSIGNRIEKRMVGDSAPMGDGAEEPVREDESVGGTGDSLEGCIRLLEGYCEDVYTAYQKELSIGAGDIAALRGYEAQFDKAFSDIKEKAEVVFLCYMSEHWKSLRTIWESAMADPGVHVTVIPVPYYLKEYDGSIDKDGMILEDTGYPDGVELTSYEEYDMEAEHPDVIIYQCPYDEYSTAMTVHPFYYVSNLYQYTERLVFIPPFYTRDIKAEDKRIRATLKDFICNPGLVYADEIIVQSEGVKDAYTEILSEFVDRELGLPADENADGETDDRKVSLRSNINADKKINAAGTAIKDWESRGRELVRAVASADSSAGVYGEDVGGGDDGSAENGCPTGKYLTLAGEEVQPTVYDRITVIPEDWLRFIRKEDSSFKKILAYYISGSVIYDNEIPELKRAGKILDVIKSYDEEITVLWFTDKYAEEILRSRKPKVWDEYAALMERFKTEGIGILDETGDAGRAATVCTAFYGDAGILMNKCRSLGKPIMWATPGTPVPVPERKDKAVREAADGDNQESGLEGEKAGMTEEIKTNIGGSDEAIAGNDKITENKTDQGQNTDNRVDPSSSVGAQIWQAIKDF